MNLSQKIWILSLVHAVIFCVSCKGKPAPDSATVAKQLKKLLNKKQQTQAPEEVESAGAFESDMILTKEQMAAIRSGIHGNTSTMSRQSRRARGGTNRKAIRHLGYRWPQAIVPYFIDKSISELKHRSKNQDIRLYVANHFTADKAKKAIMEGIKHWEDHTCIRFKPKTAALVNTLGHANHVVFYKGTGCFSNVGMTGGAQYVSVGYRCDDRGTVVHELGHALGFYHEQSRPDRDKYVRINKNNIPTKKWFNFEKYGHDEVDNYNIPYDVGSIMHYGEYYFSKDRDSGLKSIETKNVRLQGVLGQRDKLSFIDIMMANEVYICNAKCPSTTQRCKNFGYIGPNCNCMCPDGLTGRVCDQIKPTSSPCGDAFTASSGSFQTPNYPANYGTNQNCYWLIQGQPNSLVEVTFHDFKLEDDVKCGYDWLEVRTEGPHMAGPRYCSDSQHQKKIFYKVTNDKGLVLQLFSDESYVEKGFKASYRVTNVTYNDDATGNGWSDWDSWAACPVTCGGAQQMRKRTCNRADNSCPGAPFEFQACNTNSCSK